MFYSVVVTAAISGLESYCMPPSDMRAIDTSLVVKLRSMMVGAATHLEGEVYRALLSLDVWRWWRIPPPALDLLARRWGLFRVVLLEPANHQHHLAGCFGRPRYDVHREKAGQPHAGPTVDEAGRIAPIVHPWARQLVADIDYRLSFNDAAGVAADWAGALAELVADESWRQRMVMLDGDVMRAAFLASEWSPAGTPLSGAVPAPTDVEPASRGSHRSMAEHPMQLAATATPLPRRKRLLALPASFQEFGASGSAAEPASKRQKGGAEEVTTPTAGHRKKGSKGASKGTPTSRW